MPPWSMQAARYCCGSRALRPVRCRVRAGHLGVLALGGVLHEVDGVMQVEFVAGEWRQGGGVDGGVWVSSSAGTGRWGRCGTSLPAAVVTVRARVAGCRVKRKPPACTTVWCREHRSTRLDRSVRPPFDPFDQMVGVEFAAAGAGRVAAAFPVDRAEQIPQRLAGMAVLATQIVDGEISAPDRTQHLPGRQFREVVAAGW